MSSPLVSSHRIAVIAGDGIGLETTAAALRVLAQVGERWGIELEFEEFPWGCDRYVELGEMMPADGLDRLAGFEAIFLGAVGNPDVPDRVSVWELVLPIRRRFDQFVNIRPVRYFAGVQTPLEDRLASGIDFVVVRENTEGEYSEVGGILHAGTPEEVCLQMSGFTHRGTERAARYAFELASQRNGRLTSATKSNGLPHSMPFWDAVVAEVGAEFPAVELSSMHVDALAALFVLDPASLDVVVASNLFGDILSDLGAALVGGIGMGPSANLDPTRRNPSMFEPIHGSAPDIAGKGVANPVGQIWSAAMMLRHLGHEEAGDAIMGAIAAVLSSSRARTPDLGGEASTAEVTDAILAELAAPNGGGGNGSRAVEMVVAGARDV